MNKLNVILGAVCLASCVPSLGVPPASNIACDSDADCPADRLCTQGICLQVCEDESCGEGRACFEGRCAVQCMTDDECPPAELCDAGFCQSGQRAVPFVCPVPQAAINAISSDDLSVGFQFVAEGLVLNESIDCPSTATWQVCAAPAASAFASVGGCMPLSNDPVVSFGPDVDGLYRLAYEAESPGGTTAASMTVTARADALFVEVTFRDAAATRDRLNRLLTDPCNTHPNANACELAGCSWDAYEGPNADPAWGMCRTDCATLSTQGLCEVDGLSCYWSLADSRCLTSSTSFDLFEQCFLRDEASCEDVYRCLWREEVGLCGTDCGAFEAIECTMAGCRALGGVCLAGLQSPELSTPGRLRSDGSGFTLVRPDPIGFRFDPNKKFSTTDIGTGALASTIGMAQLPERGVAAFPHAYVIQARNPVSGETLCGFASTLLFWEQGPLPGVPARVEPLMEVVGDQLLDATGTAPSILDPGLPAYPHLAIRGDGARVIFGRVGSPVPIAFGECDLDTGVPTQQEDLEYFFVTLASTLPQFVDILGSRSPSELRVADVGAAPPQTSLLYVEPGVYPCTAAYLCPGDMTCDDDADNDGTPEATGTCRLPCAEGCGSLVCGPDSYCAPCVEGMACPGTAPVIGYLPRFVGTGDALLFTHADCDLEANQCKVDDVYNSDLLAGTIAWDPTDESFHLESAQFVARSPLDQEFEPLVVGNFEAGDAFLIHLTRSNAQYTIQIPQGSRTVFIPVVTMDRRVSVRDGDGWAIAPSPGVAPLTKLVSADLVQTPPEIARYDDCSVAGGPQDSLSVRYPAEGAVSPDGDTLAYAVQYRQVQCGFWVNNADVLELDPPYASDIELIELDAVPTTRRIAFPESCRPQLGAILGQPRFIGGGTQLVFSSFDPDTTEDRIYRVNVEDIPTSWDASAPCPLTLISDQAQVLAELQLRRPDISTGGVRLADSRTAFRELSCAQFGGPEGGLMLVLLSLLVAFRRWRGRFLGLVLLCVGTFLGCGSSTSSDACDRDTDCGAGELCVNARCVSSCDLDSECGDGAVCQLGICVDGASVQIQMVEPTDVSQFGVSEASVTWSASENGDYFLAVGPDCAVGTRVNGVSVTGTTLADATVTSRVPATSLEQGDNVVHVCFRTSDGVFSASTTLRRDDVAPMTTASPDGGVFSSTTDVSLTCNEPGVVAYSLDGTDPEFDSSGAVVAGAQALGPVTVGASGAVKYRCRDVAGNVESVNESFFSLAPIVTIDRVDSLVLSSTGGTQTTEVEFHSTLAGDYTVHVGPGTCLTAPIYPGIGATGSLQANEQVVVEVDAVTLSLAEGAYSLRVCVRGAGGVPNFAIRTLIIDDTAPITTPTVAGGNVCVPAIFRPLCDSCSATAYDTAGPPLFDAQGNVSSGTLFQDPNVPVSATTTFFFRSTDLGGNVEDTKTVTYTVVGNTPSVVLVSQEYPAVSTNVMSSQDASEIVFTAPGGLPYSITDNSCTVAGSEISAGTTSADTTSVVVQATDLVVGFSFICLTVNEPAGCPQRVNIPLSRRDVAEDAITRPGNFYPLDFELSVNYMEAAMNVSGMVVGPITWELGGTVMPASTLGSLVIETGSIGEVDLIWPFRATVPESTVIDVNVDVTGVMDAAGNPVTDIAGWTFQTRSRNESLELNAPLTIDGDVVDSEFNLQSWDRCSLGQSLPSCAESPTLFTWHEALGACEALNAVALGGKVDWHLPRFRELVSIIDWSQGSGPYLDPTVFLNPSAASTFWTSTGAVGGDTEAFMVDFDTASVSVVARTQTHAVRCVAGLVPQGDVGQDGIFVGPDFEVHVSELARFDVVQQFAWEKPSNSTLVDADDAATYCEGLAAMGYAGSIEWRLPTVAELLTTINSYDQPAARWLEFPAGSSFPTWSSEPGSVSGGQRLVDLYDGTTLELDGAATAYVRCITPSP